MAKPRRPFDFYPTPDDAIYPYLETHPLLSGRVLDLCAGKGNIGIALRRAAQGNPALSIDALEVQSGFYEDLETCGAYECVMIANALAPETETLLGYNLIYDVIISNPPFADAEALARLCFRHAPRVIFLLRSAFTASQERENFWETCPPCHVSFLPHRPSFTGDGETGQYDYAWFEWRRAPSRPMTFDHCPSWATMLKRMAQRDQQPLNFMEAE